MTPQSARIFNLDETAVLTDDYAKPSPVLPPSISVNLELRCLDGPARSTRLGSIMAQSGLHNFYWRTDSHVEDGDPSCERIYQAAFPCAFFEPVERISESILRPDCSPDLALRGAGRCPDHCHYLSQ